MVKKVNDLEARDIISTSEMSVLDFYAEWCGPCKVVGPILENLSEKYSEVSFAKIDIDGNSELSTTHSVRNIPTLLFFKNGELKYTKVGSGSIESLKNAIEELIKM